MRFLRCNLLTLAAVVAGMTALASAGYGSDTEGFRRWGVGWDNGIAARYMINPSWGVGIRVDAGLWYRIGTSNRWSHDNFLRIDNMVFHQLALGHGLSLGPFAEIQSTVGRGGFERALSRFGLAIGLRPALTVKDRFVLETRFGLESSFTRRVDLVMISIDEETHVKEYTRDWDDTWELHSIDDDLRLISRFRFILMF